MEGTCTEEHGIGQGKRKYMYKELGNAVSIMKDIKKAFDPLLEQLDHHYLNEVAGLENPTSETLCHWIWQRLKPNLAELTEVEISETCDSGCRYRGN